MRRPAETIGHRQDRISPVPLQGTTFLNQKTTLKVNHAAAWVRSSRSDLHAIIALRQRLTLQPLCYSLHHYSQSNEAVLYTHLLKPT